MTTTAKIIVDPTKFVIIVMVALRWVILVLSAQQPTQPQPNAPKKMWESVLQVNTAKSAHTAGRKIPALAVGMENLVVVQAQPLIVQVVAVASITQRQLAAVVQQTVMVVEMIQEIQAEVLEETHTKVMALQVSPKAHALGINAIQTNVSKEGTRIVVHARTAIRLQEIQKEPKG